jgi:peptidoglycan/xylan/chitin deacetylase (PgdA/CDA1 family)
MIGVIAEILERDVVREFFELFKTPWEFYRENQVYDVLVCAGEIPVGTTSARVVVVYSGRRLAIDDQRNVEIVSQPPGEAILAYGVDRIPVYGCAAGFKGEFNNLLTEEKSGECVAYSTPAGNTSYVRIGYDLFAEIRTLLTVGQPRENAHMPAVELHVAFLRDVITGCGVEIVEIPPVPDGYRFIVCLTHDVDHPSIRKHKRDHTAVGFFLRAVFGSVIDAMLGRLSASDALRNWVAAAKWPLVHLGLAKDFWADFDERYLKLEDGIPSTFFVIPRKGYAGKRENGSAPALRASAYEAKELDNQIRRLVGAGCEVGLHGIDAWIDSTAGCKELKEVRNLSGSLEIGIRMHWLYYAQDTPIVLERAGAAFDSTFGYNETVGYRAGTTQVYKPLGAQRLLELPLHAMDTSLFYLSYLALSPRKAKLRLEQLAMEFARFGGCLTVNWHDRSLAPERLWGGTYRELIQDLKLRGAWFATASQATAWFRKRRTAVFVGTSEKLGVSSEKEVDDHAVDLPQMRLRTHSARKNPGFAAHDCAPYRDHTIQKVVEACATGSSNAAVPSGIG